MFGTVFFAMIGAAITAWGLILCYRWRKHGFWEYSQFLMFSCIGLAILVSMLRDVGFSGYMDCVLWLLCIIDFVFWFSSRQFLTGWRPLIAALPVVCAGLILLIDPLFWIGLVGGTLMNAVLFFYWREVDRFRAKMTDDNDEF